MKNFKKSLIIYPLSKRKEKKNRSKLFLQDGATALFIAAQNGHVRILEVLLERGAKTDAIRTDGATPLWIAAQMGHDHVVRRLLKAGARVDSTRHVKIIIIMKNNIETIISRVEKY